MKSSGHKSCVIYAHTTTTTTSLSQGHFNSFQISVGRKFSHQLSTREISESLCCGADFEGKLEKIIFHCVVIIIFLLIMKCMNRRTDIVLSTDIWTKPVNIS
jgi:hypothetical protein